MNKHNLSAAIVLAIAASCHELNRQYCIALGDTSQLPWEDAPDWQQSSAIQGVEFHLKDSDASPSASHESWMKQKTEEGWKYGLVKDEAKKEHPCYVPYDDLPTEQKAKDYLFKANVHNMLRVLQVASPITPSSDNKVSGPHVGRMLDSLTFEFARIGDSTTTVCEAFLPNGFSVGSGKSACVDPANFNYEEGCKWAKERALANARNTIWQLEGYLLKVTGSVSAI